MKNKKQLIGRSIIGFVWGWLGTLFCYLLYAFYQSCMESKGSYEWEEDKTFIAPVLFIAAIYLLFVLIFIIVNLKNKARLITIMSTYMIAAILFFVRLHFVLQMDINYGQLVYRMLWWF